MPKRSHSKLFRTVLLLVVLSLGGGGWQYYFNHQTNKGEAATLVAVRKGDIEDIVTAQGKLEPLNYVDVGAQVSGQLKKIHVKIGDVVSKGALLAEIDPEVYDSLVKADQAKLKTLQAQQAQQEATLLLARQKLARNKTLIKTKAVSEETYQTAEADEKVAEAQLDSIKAQIEEAQSNLDGDQTKLGYANIYAPMDGTVVAQTSKEGQTLNASQSAPTIVQLADLDTMTVRAQVAEADVMRLKEGMSAYFTTLGDQERKWQGKVRQILPSPETVNDVVLYDVLIDVDNKDHKLMSGMSTQTFFTVAQADDVLTIPVGALGKHERKDDNDKGLAYHVLVSVKGALSDRIVHIGLMDRTQAEVRDGLNEGDQVALGGAAAAKDGARKPTGPRGFGPRL